MCKLLAVLLSASLLALAGPVGPPSTTGDELYAAGGRVDVYFVSKGSAIWMDDLYLDSPTASGLIFRNQVATPGDVVSLGSFATGTPLIFRLFNNDSNVNFFTGPGSRNPDGLVYAAVQPWQADSLIPVDGLLVSFEDMLGKPEGARSYGDTRFVFTSVQSSDVVLPEPASMALVAIPLAGLAILRKRLLRS